VLDYGCGRGTDVVYLRARGVKAQGWDPYFRTKQQPRSAEVVNLGYVLNVIENRDERSATLRGAYDFARQVLIVSVRVDKFDGLSFGDGVVTSASTFQKWFTQEEFVSYVESALKVAPAVAAPGIVYVFKDDAAKDRYLAGRAFAHRLEFRADLFDAFRRSARARRFVVQATTLGRMPLPEESSAYEKLIGEFGPRQRLERLTLRCIDPNAFNGSREERRADIMTYLAMLQLEGLRLPPYGMLPDAVKADIRTFWDSSGSAVSEARELLFSIGRPESVRGSGETAGVGKLLADDLYVHRSAVDALPVRLRILVFAATRIVGDVGWDVAKIRLDGKVISFLEYPDFDTVAHPALRRAVRVYLPRSDFAVRDYADTGNPPILHRKELLLRPDYPLYKQFKALSLEEDRLGLLGRPDIGSMLNWDELLKNERLAIVGHRVLFDH